VYSSPSEERFRLKVFTDNTALIAKHNDEAASGTHGYVLKMNQFGDMVRVCSSPPSNAERFESSTDLIFAFLTSSKSHYLIVTLL
jgi:hypothetical protein